MTHYICRGENCRTVSDRPSVCLEPGCMNRYKLLEECNCPHRSKHDENISVINYGTKSVTTKLNVINFGIAFGFVVGAYFFMIGLFAAYFGIGAGIVTQMESFYIGYNASLLGSVAGGLWGLVDGFIGGVLIAYIYNFIQKIRS